MPNRVKKIWTVRVVMFEGDSMNPPIVGVWLEQMRHLGYLNILKQYDNRTVVEFMCPHRGLDTMLWAQQESERMKSFGINAAPAPMWTGFGTLTEPVLDPNVEEK